MMYRRRLVGLVILLKLATYKGSSSVVRARSAVVKREENERSNAAKRDGPMIKLQAARVRVEIA